MNSKPAFKLLISVVRAILLGLPLLGIAAGCKTRSLTMMDTFPRASTAAPWRAEGPPWSGAFADAENSLGADAEGWRTPPPSRIWLAAYTHQGEPERRLIVRCFAFDSPEAAELALEKHRPAGAKTFKAGDDGCWTRDGVLFRWGRLVYDVFGITNQRRIVPEQVISMVGLIEHMMPPGLPDNPQ